MLVVGSMIAANAGAEQKKIGSMVIDADWTGGGDSWQATGTVRIGSLTLKDATIQLEGDELTGSSSGLEIYLFSGCAYQTGDTNFGFATGSRIREDVKNAPVRTNQTYLYFDVDDSKTFECAGLELPLKEGSNRIYVNPDDPSIYLTVSNVGNGSAMTTLARNLRKMAVVDIGEASIGVSSKGLIPWKAPEKNAAGDYETMNAQLAIIGDVAIKVGALRIATRPGSQAYRLDLQGGDVVEACSSGAIVIPGITIVGKNIDLPLGRGVGCQRGPLFILSATIGGAAWDGLGLPDSLVDVLDAWAEAAGHSQEFKVAGSVDANMGNYLFSIAGPKYQLGPWPIEGSLKIRNKGVTLEGKTDFDAGPLDFGGMDATAEFLPGDLVMATASGEADLGFKGKKVEADFTMLPGGGSLTAEAEVKIWGYKMKGNLEFDDFRFQESVLKQDFSISGVGGVIKVKIKSNGVSVKAVGKLAGESFDVGINSKGCFTVGKKFCL